LDKKNLSKSILFTDTLSVVEDSTPAMGDIPMKNGGRISVMEIPDVDCDLRGKILLLRQERRGSIQG
jgi:nitrogen fixation protein